MKVMTFEPGDFLATSIENSDGKLLLSPNAGVSLMKYEREESHPDRIPTKLFLKNHSNVLQRLHHRLLPFIHQFSQ